MTVYRLLIVVVTCLFITLPIGYVIIVLLISMNYESLSDLKNQAAYPFII